MTKKERSIIEERCSTCKYGTWHYNTVQCYHPHHPGEMGGYGTEWAEKCSDYVDTGCINRIVTITKIQRTPKK